MANRKIRAELEIDGKDSTSPAFRSVATRMGQIERQMSRFNKTASDFDRKVASINRHSAGMQRAAEGFNKAGTMLRTGIAGYGAYEVGRAIAGTVKDFAALERQMTRIGITADASATQTKEAFAQAQQIAKDLNYDSVQPAIEAIDTLVASGKSLDEAMAFLPSVLATAQATGAATQDIANTGLKAADALQIETKNMQRAFDIMVMGGKAGQFELKDMAQYIPGLANSFATLGYKGEGGLKKLVAILQTIREDTGDASSAATQAQNIFGKMYSEETGKKFAKFGIDLRKEMEAAKKTGEDAVTAFIRLSNEAIKGDLSKLPLLFSDQEFRLGMQSLMTSSDSLKRFIDTMNSADVDGTVFRDVNRVFSDTQATIDRMSSSWEKLKTSLGENVATSGATDLMDWGTKNLDYATAVNKGLEDSGVKGWWARTGFGVTSSQLEKDEMAVKGGYKDPAFLADFQARRYEAGKIKASVGRQGRPVVIADFPGGGTGKIPVPGSRPENLPPMRSLPAGIVPPELRVGAIPKVPNFGPGKVSMPSQEEFKKALRIDIDSLKDSGHEAGQKVAEGGREAGKAVEDSAAFLKVAGVDVGAQISAAAERLLEAARSFNRMQASATSLPRSAVNADTGRTFPPEISKPAGGGW
ncbi:phage tail tape measure protein [Agrobacterium sp. 22-209-1]